jgi:hypothetical protein
MGCRIRRCSRFWCLARLEVCETISGKPLCWRCWERWKRRQDARIAGAAALAELLERRKERLHRVATARIAGTAFEDQPSAWDRF